MLPLSTTRPPLAVTITGGSTYVEPPVIVRVKGGRGAVGPLCTAYPTHTSVLVSLLGSGTPAGLEATDSRWLSIHDSFHPVAVVRCCHALRHRRGSK